MKQHSSFVSFSLAILLCAAHALAAQSQVTLGPARFTVIAPNLIRLQYAADSAFTDASTLFASDRTAHFDGSTIKQDDHHVSIDTGTMLLTYTDDGTPFNATNLKIVVRGGPTDVTWTPGTTDPNNLGGTLRTLDGVRGPVDVGPGLISRSGWALVDDSKSPVLTSDWVKTRDNQSEADLYFFGYGLDYKAALKSLTTVSGPVPIPRKNLLGVWYSRFWPYTSKDYRAIVSEYESHGFPLDNIVMDMDWHIVHLPGSDNLVWTGYTWNPDLLPDAPELLKWFHAQGLAVTLNDHPADGVQPHEHAYTDFMQAMGADPAKKLSFDAGDKKYLDTFFAYTHKPLEDQGVDFWWLDWQQYPFTRSVAGLSNLAWLNRYNFLHTSADGKRGASFSRWAGWGDQRYPIHFSGDANTSWQMLAFEIPFTSTAGNVGCFFWSHDIGGHLGGRNEESYTRWCQFGATSAALRSHSTRDAAMDRRPWTYPKWAEDSMRVSFQLRSRLFPYIYSSAGESSANTVPLLKPMYIEHPDLEASYHNAQQYYFGDNFLVAPITQPGAGPSRLASQIVWFPPGTGPWFNFFTGERYNADSEAAVACDINQFPLFARGGVPIPMQPYTSRPATAALNHLVLRCYPGEIDHIGKYTLYEDDGQTQGYMSGASSKTELTYARTAAAATVTIAPTTGHYTGQVSQRAYTIELACVQNPTGVTVNGTPAQFTFDQQTSTASIEVPATALDQTITVVATTTPADSNEIRQRAIAARLSGITGNSVQPDSTSKMLATALASTTDPTLGTPLLAACGMAILPKNDSPTLYNGKESLRVYAPPGILETEQTTSAVIPSSSPDVPKAAMPVKLADGSTIDLKPFADLLPVEQSITVPGKPATIIFTTHASGHAIELRVPAEIASRPQADFAHSATATASSSETGYKPGGAIDGVADGYPNDKRHEWSSNHETENATFTLTWKTPQTISHIVLYDRPNLDDQILAGQIVFDDGSAVPFGELANDGKTPTHIKFPTKTVRWLRVEIKHVSPTTRNAGLAEIGAFSE